MFCNYEFTQYNRICPTKGLALPKKSLAQTLMRLSGLLTVFCIIVSIWDNERRWQWIITAVAMLLTSLVSAAVETMRLNKK